MRESLKTICESFALNREVVRSQFRMESDQIMPVCAYIFSARGLTADADRLAACRAAIRERTGLFSNFRGSIVAPVASLLAVSDNPEKRMSQALDNYAELKQRFHGSPYLALVAILLTDMTDTARIGEVAARGRTIYDLMRREHPFLTASEDSVFAVLMAFSDKSAEALIAEMETCYDLLRARFSDRDALQTASHILALVEGRAEDKVGRVTELFDGLMRAGRKYGRHHELATLAAVAILDAPVDRLVSDILDADAFLAGQRGYGFFGLGKTTRLMHAAMIVSDDYAPREYVETAAMASALAMIAAQQAAMCAVIASSAAASAASASH